MLPSLSNSSSLSTCLPLFRAWARGGVFHPRPYYTPLSHPRPVHLFVNFLPLSPLLSLSPFPHVTSTLTLLLLLLPFCSFISATTSYMYNNFGFSSLREWVIYTRTTTMYRKRRISKVPDLLGSFTERLNIKALMFKRFSLLSCVGSNQPASNHPLICSWSHYVILSSRYTEDEAVFQADVRKRNFSSLLIHQISLRGKIQAEAGCDHLQAKSLIDMKLWAR